MELNEIIKPENLVYTKPELMNDNPMHYCPGCSHGVIHKLIAEVIAEMKKYIMNFPVEHLMLLPIEGS